MIELYNGDCLEIMDKLIKENVKVDFVFTSPPYNRVRNDKYKNYDDNKSDYFIFLKEVIGKCLEISDYVFFNIQQTFFNTKEVHKVIGYYSDYILNNIIWVKSNPQPNNNVKSVVNSYEYIFVMSKTKETAEAKILGTKNIIETPVYSQNPFKDIHNAVMNPKIVDWFIEHFTSKGQTILDCFMGTGTTGERCKAYDRNFIGIELSKEYFDLSKNRIDKFVVQERISVDLLTQSAEQISMIDLEV